MIDLNNYSNLIVTALKTAAFLRSLIDRGVSDEVKERYAELRAAVKAELGPAPHGGEWTDEDVDALAAQVLDVNAEIRARHTAE